MTFIIRNNKGLQTDRKVKAITVSDTPYSITTTDEIILVNASGGATTVTLPTAVVGVAGKTYIIKRTDILASSVLVTIATTSSQTIDSAPAHYLWPGEYVELVSDNANWQVIHRTAINTTNLLKGTTADRRYCTTDRYCTALTSTTSPAINTLWATPKFVPQTTKFDTITFNLTTGAASSQARMGIYRDNGNFYPGALVFDSGALSAVTLGIINSTITAGIQVFPVGLYWLAWECDTTGLQIMSHSSTTAGGSIDGLAGRAAAFTAAGVPSYGYSVAHTFGALPDPYTAGATLLASAPALANPVPYLALRPI